MEREDYIDVDKKNAERKEKAQKIQRAYLEYMTGGNEEYAFAELMKLQDAYCIPWIRKKLGNMGCYVENNEEDILQESRQALWDLVSKEKKNKTIRESFAYYAFGIYKNKTLEAIRRICRKRARLDVHSFEEPVGDGGKKIGDIVPPEISQDVLELEEIRRMCSRLFQVYCKAFMSSSAFPPRCLALYYARVLPHLLGVIPESKAASAKWAFEKIDNRTVGALGEDSEKTLCRKVKNDLRWGRDFIRQLNEIFEFDGGKIYLKDVVYTEAYGKGKIEDWADSMHKTARKDAAEMVQKEPELLNLAKEYVSKKDILYCFVKEEETR